MGHITELMLAIEAAGKLRLCGLTYSVDVWLDSCPYLLNLIEIHVSHRI